MLVLSATYARFAFSLDSLLLRLAAIVLKDVHYHIGSTVTQTENTPGLLDGHVVRHALLLLDGVSARRKNNVELLKRTFLGLDAEEVDDRDEEEVEDGEDDVLPYTP